MGLEAVATILACPRCESALTLADRVLRCRADHAFDVARQGYANLLQGPQPASADTAAMLSARAEFLARGHYDPIADAVAGRLRGRGVIVDAGAGTGFYLARCLDAHPRAVGLATDVSVAACRRAARAHPRLGAVVADTWRHLPVRAGRVDAVLAIFAPRNMVEFRRVLRPGGLVVAVTPTDEHLREAREALGLLGVEPGKQERLDRNAQTAGLEPIGATRVAYPVELDATELAAVVDMGPNAFHDHPAARHRLRVTVSVRVAWWRAPLGQQDSL